MLSGFEIIFKDKHPEKMVFRFDGNPEKRILIKDFIKKEIPNVSPKKINQAFEKKIKRYRKKIRETYDKNVADKMILESQTKEFKKAFKNRIRKTLEAKDIEKKGSVKFKNTIKKITSFVNVLYKEIG